jgi:hypothetical protein
MNLSNEVPSRQEQCGRTGYGRSYRDLRKLDPNSPLLLLVPSKPIRCVQCFALLGPDWPGCCGVEWPEADGDDKPRRILMLVYSPECQQATIEDAFSMHKLECMAWPAERMHAAIEDPQAFDTVIDAS